MPAGLSGTRWPPTAMTGADDGLSVRIEKSAGWAGEASDKAV